MNQWIAQYVKGCSTCQQNKIITHRKCTPPYRITTKEDTLPFQQVVMDLITGLPTHNGKDAILTIVDYGCSRACEEPTTGSFRVRTKGAQDNVERNKRGRREGARRICPQ